MVTDGQEQFQVLIWMIKLFKMHKIIIVLNTVDFHHVNCRNCRKKNYFYYFHIVIRFGPIEKIKKGNGLVNVILVNGKSATK